LVETWHVDEVTIVGVSFCGKDQRDMTQNPTSVKITWSNKTSPSYAATIHRCERKSWSIHALGVVERNLSKSQSIMK